jgi:hypothetical protein
MDQLSTIFLLLAYAALIGLFLYVGYPSRFTLLEHQRGILFRRGLPVRELGPGRYWIWTKREKVFWLDVRPIQVSFDNQGAVLNDGAAAVFGLLGSARIADAHKATYCARNCSQVPGFVLHCCTRSVLNSLPATQISDSKEKLADEIISRVTPRLAAAGLELLSFRLTHLSLAAPPPAQE